MKPDSHKSSSCANDPVHLSISLLVHAAPYRPRRRWLGTRAYWLCQALGWGGLFLLMSGPLPLKARSSGAELAAILVFALSGLLLSHLLRAVIVSALDSARSYRGLLLRTVPWLLLLLITHVGFQIFWAREVLPHQTELLSSRPGQDPFLFAFADIFCLSAGVFVAWLGFYFGLLTYRQFQAARIERLELAAHVQEAAWQALRAQLNPHLLFNSLNSIRALIPRDQNAPREALTHLSELLRSSLSMKQDEMIPLNREMGTVDSFLALERLRFEERLRVTRVVSDEVLSWMVPPFLVQCLIENALKYGVSPFEEGGEVQLEIHRFEDHLIVDVLNRGQLGASSALESTGLGLSNLRSRLALLFGPSASLSLENFGPDKVRARAVVPRDRLT